MRLLFVGNTVGITTLLSVHYPISLRSSAMANRADGRGGARLIARRERETRWQVQQAGTWIRQSKPGSGLGFQTKVRQIFEVVAASLSSGPAEPAA